MFKMFESYFGGNIRTEENRFENYMRFKCVKVNIPSDKNNTLKCHKGIRNVSPNCALLENY